jgi:hypothetical protein
MFRDGGNRARVTRTYASNCSSKCWRERKLSSRKDYARWREFIGVTSSDMPGIRWGMLSGLSESLPSRPPRRRSQRRRWRSRGARMNNSSTPRTTHERCARKRAIRDLFFRDNSPRSPERKPGFRTIVHSWKKRKKKKEKHQKEARFRSSDLSSINGNRKLATRKSSSPNRETYNYI